MKAMEIQEKESGGTFMNQLRNDFQSTSEYVASKELLTAVNVAMTLQKPLLIKGEPGTGKTMLAEAFCMEY